MQMSLGPEGATHMEAHICLNKENNDMLFAHFLPHLTAALAAKQNKIQHEKIRGMVQYNVKIIRSNKGDTAVKGVVQLGEGRDFRRLVSSLDALCCGWSFEIIEL